MRENNAKLISYGIMQPYFLPYAGYFSLIKKTNRWIVFDKTQFRKQSWGSRNRILMHPEGISKIIVPTLKHSRNDNYSEIKVNNTIDWKSKIINQLEFYKINAPNYKQVRELIEKILEPDFEFLVDLNIHTLSGVCDYLGIEFKHEKFSELDLKLDEVRHSGDWALQICKSAKINSYINPSLGHFLFKEEDWIDENIDLKFLLLEDYKYNQGRESFEEKLSIIDVLMWNSIEDVHKILDSSKILTHKEISNILN